MSLMYESRKELVKEGKEQARSRVARPFSPFLPLSLPVHRQDELHPPKTKRHESQVGVLT